MKVRKFLPSALAVVLLLALAGIAYAFTMGNVDGVWGTVGTDGASCDRWATGPAGGSTSYDSPTATSDTNPGVQTGSTTDWNQVRYGTEWWGSCLSFANQSGFGFDGVNDVVDPPHPYEDVPFYLGKFCHFNNPINASNSFDWVNLAITVSGLACPPGGTIDKTSLSFSYRFYLDETDNNASPCPYGDTQPCGDLVTISRQTYNASFRCTYGGGAYTDYTIEVLGFIPESLGGTCPGAYNSAWVKNNFFSDENADNCACLWAQVTEYTPTAVELLWFEATSEKRAITLGWETASEVDNLGFNLYRARTADGPRFQINAELIPSQVYPGSPTGAVYEIRDRIVIPRSTTYYYWLEDVDISGRTELHGPIEVNLARGLSVQEGPSERQESY